MTGRYWPWSNRETWILQRWIRFGQRQRQLWALWDQAVYYGDSFDTFALVWVPRWVSSVAPFLNPGFLAAVDWRQLALTFCDDGAS